MLYFPPLFRALCGEISHFRKSCTHFRKFPLQKDTYLETLFNFASSMLVKNRENFHGLHTKAFLFSTDRPTLTHSPPRNTTTRLHSATIPSSARIQVRVHQTSPHCPMISHPRYWGKFHYFILNWKKCADQSSTNAILWVFSILTGEIYFHSVSLFTSTITLCQSVDVWSF